MTDIPRRDARRDGERGFTLIELLVVILIIGILAAIALPSFIAQSAKANDAQAKSLARNAATALETYGTDHNGDYTAATPASLTSVESTIGTISNTSTPYVASLSGGQSSYVITVADPKTGGSYTLTNNNGTVTRTCSGSAGCSSGSW